MPVQSSAATGSRTTTSAAPDHDVDVLIVGGGPCGLSASLALSALGVRSLLVERHPGTTPHPKALHLSTRTMEVLRGWGIAEDVRKLALPLSDHALFHGSSIADPGHVRHPIWPADPTLSPERPHLVSQEVLEPELRRQAEARSARRPPETRLFWDTRLSGLSQDDDEVVAEIEHGAGGPRERVRAQYVIGADGAASAVREAAGIDFPGHVVHESVNIRFRADLRELLADRRSAFYYVQNSRVRGLLPVVDNALDWRLHLMLGPGETLADYESTERRLELIRAAVGIEDLDVDLLPIFGWTAAARVADHYRSGRLFLAGDAAHVNPPSGGLGMNCGIQDVANLTWKLAAVLHGTADAALLDTYEPERRPVALRTVREAEQNHLFEAAPVHTEEDRRRKHDRRRMNGFILGQHLDEGAFTPDGTPPPVVADSYSDYVPTARPGHRAPHVWLERDGSPISSLDLLRWDRPTLLVGSAPGAPALWREAAADEGVRLVVVGAPHSQVGDVGEVGDVGDPNREFSAAYGISDSGAVLVRQDGVVAARWPDAPPDVAGARSLLHHAFGARSDLAGTGAADRQ